MRSTSANPGEYGGEEHPLLMGFLATVCATKPGMQSTSKRRPVFLAVYDAVRLTACAATKLDENALGRRGDRSGRPPDPAPGRTAHHSPPLGPRRLTNPRRAQAPRGYGCIAGRHAGPPLGNQPILPRAPFGPVA